MPAYGQEDTDWAGRARLDDSSWLAVATEITTSPTQVVLAPVMHRDGWVNEIAAQRSPGDIFRPTVT